MSYDAIVTAPGSLGDVNPLLAVAKTMQNRGMKVLFVTAERYVPLAERAGLNCEILVNKCDFDKIVSSPELWHPRHGLKLLLRDAMLGSLPSQYARLQKYCRPGETVLVSHFLDFASRVFLDSHPATNLHTVILAPATIRSLDGPSQLSAPGWETRGPRWLRKLLFVLADRWVDGFAGPGLNQFRREVHLPAIRKIIQHWSFSPQSVIALFPTWFAAAQEDWPKSIRQFDFPLADSHGLIGKAVDHVALERIDAWGKKPILFAPGTANDHGEKYYEAGLMVAEHLQHPVVLLSAVKWGRGRELPENVLCADYIPFSRLLPKVSAIVHHGGIGTTSQALCYGLPQLVLPMAFDQFDNGRRVSLMGCGGSIPLRLAKPTDIVETIKNLLISDNVRKSVDQARGFFDSATHAEPNCSRVVDYIMSKE